MQVNWEMVMENVAARSDAGEHAPRRGKKGERRLPRAKTMDIHIGARVRLRRVLLGMSQSALAAKVGITFQQIQKYERGDNRISAASLLMVSEALDVPVTFFYDSLEGGGQQTPQVEKHSRWQLEVCRMMEALPEPLRLRVYETVKALFRCRSEQLSEVADNDGTSKAAS